jgi:hypothetical protein
MLLQYYCNISFLIFGIWISSALNFELVLLELCISEDVIIALQKKKKKELPGIGMGCYTILL